MEARINLYPGRPIRAADLQTPAVIDRNDIVTLRFAADGLMIVTRRARARPRRRGGAFARNQPLVANDGDRHGHGGPGAARVGGAP